MPVTTYPITLACWFNVDNITNNYFTMALSEASGNVFAGIQLRGGAAGDKAAALVFDGGASIAISDVAYVAGVWNFVCCRFASTTSRSCILNEGTVGTNVTERSPSTPDEYTVGRASSGNPQFMEGHIAEPTVWDVILTDDEALGMARGVHLRKVRPLSQVAYNPVYGLDSPEPDLSVKGIPVRW